MKIKFRLEIYLLLDLNALPRHEHMNGYTVLAYTVFLVLDGTTWRADMTKTILTPKTLLISNQRL